VANLLPTTLYKHLFTYFPYINKKIRPDLVIDVVPSQFYIMLNAIRNVLLAPPLAVKKKDDEAEDGECIVTHRITSYRIESFLILFVSHIISSRRTALYRIDLRIIQRIFIINSIPHKANFTRPVPYHFSPNQNRREASNASPRPHKPHRETG
jgi:hypothetical protein